MRKRRIVRAVALVALVGAAGFAFLLYRADQPGGIDDVYTAAFGPPDLGDVEFETLVRRSSPNDALACPPDLCAAPVDFETPTFDVPGARLREIVREVAAAEPGTELVYSARWAEVDRFVARSALMRYPDTINSHVFGAGPGRSQLALYSRSQIGHSDLGVNRARLERWLDEIARRVAAEAGGAASSRSGS